MKKLQIMAWVLSALLLTGCGGSGTPTNTDNLPQTSLLGMCCYFTGRSNRWHG